MITLRTSPGSPFGRKARMAVIHLGLETRVDVVPTQTSNPEDPVHRFNPLHKMPVLVDENETAIYDSPVILEYLDWLAGGDKIIPRDAGARYPVLVMQALADGITEAFILVRYEDRWRKPEHFSQPWLAHQRKKIADALAALDRRPPPDAGMDVGQIAVACALGYHDRGAGPGWRESHPRLSSWFNDFAIREPSFGATQT